MSNPVSTAAGDPKTAIDLVSITWLIGIFFANLPKITALLVFIWTLMRLYQGWQEIRINRRKLDQADDR